VFFECFDRLPDVRRKGAIRVVSVPQGTHSNRDPFLVAIEPIGLN
jgi:hypothetical protein